MKIGTTSFAYRYLLQDPQRAPSLETIVGYAKETGLDMLQICENARPMELSADRWSALMWYAASCGVEIQLGCKSLDAEVIHRHLLRARDLPSRRLRVVLEADEAGHPPAADTVRDALANIFPMLESTGTTLAIENHFDVPCSVLATAVRPYPASQVGFCVDTANSLRNFEPPERVMDLLGDRAFCYHLKDYRVDGHMLGFTVGGAPLGAGKLDIGAFLESVFRHTADPEIFLENWVPATGNREQDIAEDDRWLRASLSAAQVKFAAPGVK